MPTPRGGLERGQQVAGAAADVEHALAGGDARAQHAGQVVVEVAARPRRAGDPLGMRLVEGADLLDDGLLGGGRSAQAASSSHALGHGKNSSGRRRTRPSHLG